MGEDRKASSSVLILVDWSIFLRVLKVNVEQRRRMWELQINSYYHLINCETQQKHSTATLEAKENRSFIIEMPTSAFICARYFKTNATRRECRMTVDECRPVNEAD